MKLEKQITFKCGFQNSLTIDSTITETFSFTRQFYALKSYLLTQLCIR